MRIMGTYTTYDQWGKSYNFKIKGDSPSATELGRARKHMGLPDLEADPGAGLLSDLGSAAKAGVGGLQSGAGWLTGIESWEEAGKARQAEAAREMSPLSTEAQAKGVFGGGGMRALALGAAETIPQIIPSLGAAAIGAAVAPESAVAGIGAAILRMLPQAGVAAIERSALASGVSAAAKAGELVAGALSGAGIEGLLSAGMNGQQAKEAILAIARDAPQEFKNSEIGSKYLAKWKGDYAKAAEAAADEIANGIALKTGLIAGVTAIPGAGIESLLMRNIGKGAAKTALGGAARGAALGAGQEALEEAIQSGSEQAIASGDISRAGGPQGTWGDVGRAAAEGAALGSVLGGSLGGAAGYGASRGISESQRTEDLQTYLDSTRLEKPPVPPLEWNLDPIDRALAVPFKVTASSDGINSDGSPINPHFSLVGANSGTVYQTAKTRDELINVAASKIAELSSPESFDRTRGFTKAKGVPVTQLAKPADPVVLPPSIKMQGQQAPGQLTQSSIVNPLRTSGTAATSSLTPSDIHPATRFDAIAQNRWPPYPETQLPSTNLRQSGMMDMPGQFDNRRLPGASFQPVQNAEINAPILRTEGQGSASFVPVRIGVTKNEPVAENMQGPATAQIRGRKVQYQPLSKIDDGLSVDGSVPVEEALASYSAFQPILSPDIVQGNIIPQIELVRPPVQKFGVSDKTGKHLGFFLSKEDAKSWLPEGGKITSAIVPVPTKENVIEGREKLRASLRSRLDSYGLKDIALNIEQSLGTDPDGREVLGLFQDKAIKLSTEMYSPKMGPDALASALSGTLDHEVIHSLRSRSFFSPSEWNLLSKFIQKKKFKADGKEHSFTWWDHAVGVNPNASDDAVIEEAVSNLFKAWVKDKSVAPGTAGGLLRRLVDFIKRLGGAINSSGVGDIFRSIEEGAPATRMPSPPASMIKPTSPVPALPMFSVNPAGPIGSRIPPMQRPFIDGYKDSLYYGAAYDAIHKTITAPAQILGIHKIFNLQAKEMERSIENWMDDRIWKVFQSDKIQIGRFLDSLKEAGGFIKPGMNPWLLKDLTTTAAATEIKSAWANIFDPAVKATRAIPFSESDMTALAALNPEAKAFLEFNPSDRQGVMALYLYSRHAPERNAEMSRRTKGVLESGSGMSTEAAQQIQAFFANHPAAKQVQAAADLWYQGIKDMRRVQIQYGLTPDYEAQEGDTPRYQWYVPLRGFLEDGTRDDPDNVAAYIGRGSSIYGRESPSATGRESQAGKILESIMGMHTAAVIRGHRNKEGQAFAKLVRENSDIEIGGKKISSLIKELKKAPVRFVYDSDTGYVKQATDPSYKQRKDIFIVKEGGAETIFEGPVPLMEAMRGSTGMSNSNLENAIRGIARGTRIIGRLATSLNPEYLLSNMPRDLINAVLNSTGIKGIDHSTIHREFLPALKDIRLTLSQGKAVGGYGKIYNRLQELGGTTESLGLKTLEDISRGLQRDLSSGDPSRMKQGWRWLGEFIENNNTAAENASRVVVFDMVRKARFSEIEAALRSGSIDPATAMDLKENAELEAAGHAKNLTVNFDEGGTFKTGMNALYLFFNASIQGSFAILGALGRSGKARKIVSSIVAAGAVADMMNSALSGLDDEGRSYYDSIPDYILERNIVLMVPGTSTALKIPMPYGYNAIFNTGRLVSQAVRGKKAPLDAVSEAVTGVAEAVNPLGGSHSFFNFVSPTVFDPLVDLANNRDFTEKPIYPEAGFTDTKPQHMQFWGNTNPIWIWAANQLAIGSTDSISSPVPMLEVSPNQLEYLFDFLIGGAGTFLTRTAGAGIEAVAGDPTSEFGANDLPFVRKLVTNVTARNSLSTYMESRVKLLQIDRELKGAREAGDITGLRQARQSYSREISILNRFKNLDKKRSAISKKIREIQNSALADQRKFDLIRQLKKQSDHLVGRANNLTEGAGL